MLSMSTTACHCGRLEVLIRRRRSLRPLICHLNDLSQRHQSQNTSRHHSEACNNPSRPQGLALHRPTTIRIPYSRVQRGRQHKSQSLLATISKLSKSRLTRVLWRRLNLTSHRVSVLQIATFQRRSLISRRLSTLRHPTEASTKRTHLCMATPLKPRFLVLRVRNNLSPNRTIRWSKSMTLGNPKHSIKPNQA